MWAALQLYYLNKECGLHFPLPVTGSSKDSGFLDLLSYAGRSFPSAEYKSGQVKHSKHSGARVEGFYTTRTCILAINPENAFLVGRNTAVAKGKPRFNNQRDDPVIVIK